MVASQRHAEIVPLPLAAGSEPSIRDSKHDGHAIGWADYFRKSEIVQILTNR